MRLAAIGGCAVGAVLAAALAFAWLSGRNSLTPTAKLDIALRLSQKGQAFDAAKMVDDLSATDLAQDADRAKLELIKGIHSFEVAQRASLRASHFQRLDEAEKHLTAAAKLGFPSGFDPLGSYFAGATYFELNRPEEAIAYLETAISRFPAGRFDAMEKRVEIELARPIHNVRRTEDLIKRWKELPAASSEQLHKATIALAKLRLLEKKFKESIELSETVPEPSTMRPEADLMIATANWESLQEDLKTPSDSPNQSTDSSSAEVNSDSKDARSVDATREERLESMISRLITVLRNNNTLPQTKLQAKYQIAAANRALHRYDQAISDLALLRGSAPQTIEALAAAVEELDILTDLKRWSEAILTLRQMSLGFGDLRLYENHWRPLPLLHDLLINIGNKFVREGAYEDAISFSELSPPFITEEDRLRLRAPAYVGLAKQQQEIAQSNAEILPMTQLISKRQAEPEQNASGTNKPSIQRMYATAGKSYEQLANLQLMAIDFPELLWAAIDNYSLGKEYVRSNLLLDKYLDVESKDKHPKAFVKKAENYFELGQRDSALDSLNRCIADSGDHPLCYLARLQAAKILREESKFDEAAEHLLYNLYDGSLAPSSPIWQDSLFDLGLLYSRSGLDSINLLRNQYNDEATLNKRNLLEQMRTAEETLLQGVQRLEEAIQRVPTDPRIYRCMYRIAESYRVAAEHAKLELSAVSLASADSRESVRQERDERLRASQKAYASLKDKLIELGDDLGQDPTLQQMLRNSYLGEADVSFELQSYESALISYRNAANRFLTKPIALEALTRAAQCLLELGRKDEALRTIKQASDLLGRLDESTLNEFGETTRGTKEEWASFLTWMTNSIQSSLK